MPDKHKITGEIGIDAGHRVTYHGSKCRNPHGHRYTIQATCEGELATEGEEMGMVLDFGFLKEEMMNEIDTPCDHGFIVWNRDEVVLTMFGFQSMIEEFAATNKALSVKNDHDMKVYVVPFVPTAENLARHWFECLAPRIDERSNGRASLLKVVVWETPNCSAEYPVA